MTSASFRSAASLAVAWLGACSCPPAPAAPQEVSALPCCRPLAKPVPVLLHVPPNRDDPGASEAPATRVFRSVVTDALTSMFGSVVPIRDDEDAHAFELCRDAAKNPPYSITPVVLVVADYRVATSDWPGQVSLRVFAMFDPREDRAKLELWYGRPMIYEDFAPLGAETTRSAFVAATAELATRLREDLHLAAFLDAVGPRMVGAQDPSSAALRRAVGYYKGRGDEAKLSVDDPALHHLLFPLQQAVPAVATDTAAPAARTEATSDGATAEDAKSVGGPDGQPEPRAPAEAESALDPARPAGAGGRGDARSATGSKGDGS